MPINPVNGVGSTIPAVGPRDPAQPIAATVAPLAPGTVIPQTITASSLITGAPSFYQPTAAELATIETNEANLAAVPPATQAADALGPSGVSLAQTQAVQNANAASLAASTLTGQTMSTALQSQLASQQADEQQADASAEAEAPTNKILIGLGLGALLLALIAL